MDEELIGCLIDIIEDFLDEYTGDSRVHIKGELYDSLAKQLRDTLENWRQ